MINLFYQTWYFHHFYFFKPNLARFHSCRNLWRSASVLLSVEFKFYWHIWLGLNLHRSITKTYQRGNEILKELFNNQFFIYMDVAKHVVKMMQSFRCYWFYVHPLIFYIFLKNKFHFKHATFKILTRFKTKVLSVSRSYYTFMICFLW